ncbi:MAG: hypothetical protein EAX91_17610 [Candidatus Lokiarchaeota archaeon]|nr:hypothetical protein [Candidatus Lokiarchaeota archaeon]
MLTHYPPSELNDPTITFLKGNIANAIDRALKAAAGKNVVIIGASVAQQSIEAGLIDEIFIHIVPILLGDGIPLFRHKNFSYTKLRLIKSTQSGQITNLHFRVSQ